MNNPKPIPELSSDDIARFWSKVDKLGRGGCWEWRGGLTVDGYGQFSVTTTDGKRTLRSHRVSFALSPKQLTNEGVIDHICRNRICVNPEHLREVNTNENILCGVGPTAINARKERCAAGHLYEGENLSVTEKGYRLCKECRRQYARDGRARARQQSTGVTSSSSRRVSWSESEIATVDRRDLTTTEKAELLGRTYSSVEGQVRRRRKAQAGRALAGKGQGARAASTAMIQNAGSCASSPPCPNVSHGNPNSLSGKQKDAPAPAPKSQCGGISVYLLPCRPSTSFTDFQSSVNAACATTIARRIIHGQPRGTSPVSQ